MWQFIWLRHDSYSLFPNGIIFFFSKLIIFIAYSLNDSQNFFMQSSPLYTSCWFSIPWNVHIKDIAYLQGIQLALNNLNTWTLKHFVRSNKFVSPLNLLTLFRPKKSWIFKDSDILVGRTKFELFLISPSFFNRIQTFWLEIKHSDFFKSSIQFLNT